MDNKKIGKEHSCPCCYSDGMTVFHQVENVPVNSVLNLKTRDQAVNFPRGDIAMGFCESCGFISNISYDPEALEYSTEYESTQSFSATYSTFAKRQAEQLIERHNLRGKNLLEIGCGNGEFLALLCELGDNRGLGFDPAYKEGRVVGRNDIQVEFIKDFYSEKYSGHRADFIYCRMTLEHIPHAGEFVDMVRRSIGEHTDVIVFFQVPDVTRILRDCAFEDIYYEHCSYFSPGSLARLFHRNNFEVLNVATGYDGQYVMIDAKLRNSELQAVLPVEDDMKQLKRMVSEFPVKLKGKLSKWCEQLDHITPKNGRAVIWGAGSKGVAALTTLGIGDKIGYAVDINPYRQGTYMAGTGHEIVAPEFLKKYKPDVVIIMNGIYRQEIEQDLKKMGLAPRVLTL
jgi:SAM-dependent methyltransferase